MVGKQRCCSNFFSKKQFSVFLSEEPVDECCVSGLCFFPVYLAKVPVCLFPSPLSTTGELRDVPGLNLSPKNAETGPILPSYPELVYHLVWGAVCYPMSSRFQVVEPESALFHTKPNLTRKQRGARVPAGSPCHPRQAKSRAKQRERASQESKFSAVCSRLSQNRRTARQMHERARNH